MEIRELALLRAQLALARAKHRRGTESGSTSASQEEADLERRIADVDVRQAQRALNDAKEAKYQHVVRAPRDGVVVQINVRIGQLIAPGTTDSASYLAIADATGVQVDAEGDEFDVAEIKPGSVAKVRIEALGLTLDALVAGTPALTRRRGSGLSTSMYVVRLEAPDTLPVGSLGMTARVTIGVAKRVQVRSVDPDAIVPYSGRMFLISQATQKPLLVEVGLCAAEACELLSGPPTGTRVLRGTAAMLKVRSWGELTG